MQFLTYCQYSKTSIRLSYATVHSRAAPAHFAARGALLPINFETSRQGAGMHRSS